MSTAQKRTRKKRPGNEMRRKAQRSNEVRRRGGHTGLAFRERLEILLARDCGGSQREFARRIKAAGRSGPDFSPRIGEWRIGRNLPSSENLRLIADTFRVSTDWLLGRTDNEREWVGDLATRLMHHVVREYGRRTTRQRRDGLAQVLGGSIADADLPMPKKPGDAWPPEPSVGDTLADGRIVTHLTLSGVRVLDAEPGQFLEILCDRITRDAEALEEAQKEREGAEFRRLIGSMMDDVPGIAASIKIGGTLDSVPEPEECEAVLRRLCVTAVDPHDHAKQAEVLAMFRAWRQWRARKERYEATINEIVARVIPSDNE